jgi:prepilin-type N-terminal cleavage/methylation domain-containing protein
MRAQRGFSLIELLIVVAILLILAAIAIPSFLDSKMRANEASAVGSLRQIGTAQSTYSITYPDVGYAVNLSDLGPGTPTTSAAAGLIDDVLGCPGSTCNKSGYGFTLTTGSGFYSIAATPITVGQSGRRSFYGDSSGVIRYNTSGTTATINDSPL